MSSQSQSPAELRAMFGANLRQLAQAYPSISDLSRQLGINRTQFNRYLAAESFARPDVLARICAFFGVDARVLLEPVAEIGSAQDPLANPFLRNHLGARAQNLPAEMFPDGFYRFSRRSFIDIDVFIVGMVHAHRDGANTYLRGYELPQAMQMQNLPTGAGAREFRGLVMQQEDGIVILASRNNAMTGSFNYLSRVASFENNFWVGYVTRTIPEMAGGIRATRLVYEYVGKRARDALAPRRTCGFVSESDLPAFHKRLLQPDKPFS